MAELNHTHTGYDNFVLAVKFEDQYKTKLDLMPFVTVDNSLVGVAGDKIKVHTYKATDGTETLKMGKGNTKNIEVTMDEKEYTIELLQNRFPYYDEELMKDPKLIDKGIEHMAVDMFNTSMQKCIAEFKKATLKAEVDAFDFDAFVDGVALFPSLDISEKTDGMGTGVFAFASREVVKEIRKNLRDELKYIEAYVRTGYIGTVNGVNIYTSALLTEADGVILATKKAVHYKNKLGTEIEQSTKFNRSADDANVRLNEIFSRKYGMFVFYDDREAVKLVKKTVTPPEESETLKAKAATK